MRFDDARRPTIVKCAALIVVGIGAWALVIKEVRGLKRRIDGVERDRSLVEVETIGKVVRRSISIAQRRPGESLFDELEDAAEIVRDMRDVAGFGIGRDDDQRDTEAVFVGVDKFG